MLSVWLAFGAIPLAAVTVMLVVPVAVGVPDMSAVPLPLSMKDQTARQRGTAIGDGRAWANRWL